MVMFHFARSVKKLAPSCVADLSLILQTVHHSSKLLAKKVSARAITGAMSYHSRTISEGSIPSISRHSQYSQRGALSRNDESRPHGVHAASLLCLQMWAFVEVGDMLPPLGKAARDARLWFVAIVLARCVMVVLSFPVGAFLRLFGPSGPRTLRRRRVSIAFGSYVMLTIAALYVVEGWKLLESVYFAAATLTTIGCADIVPRSVIGQSLACSLALAGPVCGALFWRDARDRAWCQNAVQSLEPHPRERGRSPALSDDEETSKEKDARAARVADAVWAFVGLLMLLVASSAILFRKSSGAGEKGGWTSRDRDGGGDERFVSPVGEGVVEAGFLALLTLSTVGHANLAFRALSPEAGVLYILLMLLGTIAFSRAIWALVDVLLPRPAVPFTRRAQGFALSGLRPASPTSVSPSPPAFSRSRTAGTGPEPSQAGIVARTFAASSAATLATTTVTSKSSARRSDVDDAVRTAARKVIGQRSSGYRGSSAVEGGEPGGWAELGHMRSKEGGAQSEQGRLMIPHSGFVGESEAGVGVDGGSGYGQGMRLPDGGGRPEAAPQGGGSSEEISPILGRSSSQGDVMGENDSDDDGWVSEEEQDRSGRGDGRWSGLGDDSSRLDLGPLTDEVTLGDGPVTDTNEELMENESGADETLKDDSGTQDEDQLEEAGVDDTPDGFSSWSTGQVDGGAHYAKGLEAKGELAMYEDVEEALVPQLEVVHEGDEEDESSSSNDDDRNIAGHIPRAGEVSQASHFSHLQHNAPRLMIPVPNVGLSASRASGFNGNDFNGSIGGGGDLGGDLIRETPAWSGASSIGVPSPQAKSLSCDEFIVKRLMAEGKLGRMEAMQMMLEFEQLSRGADSPTASAGGSTPEAADRNDAPGLPPNFAPLMASADPSSIHPAAASSQRRREGGSQLLGTPHIRSRGGGGGKGGQGGDPPVGGRAGGRPHMQRADSGLLPTKGRGGVPDDGSGVLPTTAEEEDTFEEQGGTIEEQGGMAPEHSPPVSPPPSLPPAGL